MLTRVAVSLARSPYESIVGRGVLFRTGEFVREVLRPGRCVVITDANVGPLYAEAVTGSLKQAGFTPVVVTIEAGEQSKSLGSAEALCDRMIASGLEGPHKTECYGSEPDSPTAGSKVKGVRHETRELS